MTKGRTSAPRPADAKPVKPGWRTTEFWLSALATVSGLGMASGALAAGSTAAQTVGLIASALTAMGYSASRGRAKS